MAKKDHYAILVTITKYPGLSDLNGPESDGEALAEWLISPDGGNLPSENITHIKTTDFEPISDLYEAKPTEIQLKKVLDQRLREGEGVERRWKDKAGERLYLFFAGHGFTAGSSLTDPALFSAVAQNGDTAHIAGYRYAAKIANAGFFDEILLFMDCCQDILKSSQVLEPTWSPPDRNRSHKVKLLQAFGAPRGKNAYERDLDGDGVVRGLFTVVLLEALRTAIPDTEGWVNGYDFKKQFAQIWSKRFRDDTHYDPPVRIPDGEDIRILHRPQQPPSASAVSPGSDNTTIKIDFSDIGPISIPNLMVHRQGNVSDYIKNFRVDKGFRDRSNLPTGIFTIETEGDQNDFAFEVLPSEGTLQTGHIEFHEVPAESAAVPKDQRFNVIVNGADSTIQVKILDSDYNILAIGDGLVEAELTPGIYKAEVTAGGAQSQELFRVVDGPLTVIPPIPLFPAAAPVMGTSTTHEYQSVPANNLASDGPLHSFPRADSELMVFIRVSGPNQGAKIIRPYPWENLFIRNFALYGEELKVPLEALDENSFFGATKIAVPAGCYVLVSAVIDNPVENEFGFALHTIPGWRTEVYIDSELQAPDKTGLSDPLAKADFSHASIHLVKLGESPLVFDKLGTHTELARIRLAAGRRSIIPSDEDVERSPMLGIYAAYAAFQRNPDDKCMIKRCLQAIPPEVRNLTDVKLLEAWLYPDIAVPLLQPLEIPLLTQAWDLSRQLPPKKQLAPELRGLIGQWRIGGSQWTSWRRPTQLNTISPEGVQAAVDYSAKLATSHRSPIDMKQKVSLELFWNMEDWRKHQDYLRTTLPDATPFQQALRRRLLDAIAMQEDVCEDDLYRLGDQYDLEHNWTAMENSIFQKLLKSIALTIDVDYLH